MRASLFAAMLSFAGCSVIVDDSTQQCKQDSDCTDLGLAGMTCQKQVCASPVGGQLGPECQNTADCAGKGAGFACNANNQCVMGGCTTHSECTAKAGGVASICRVDGQCATLFSPECDSVIPAGAEKSDDMYLVGFMGLVKGEQASYGIAQRDGEARALGEIQNNLFKLPGAGNASKRNLSILVCDHGTDGKNAANHLVNDLQVSAVLGASYSGITQNLYDIAKPKNVLVFSPSATSPFLTTYDTVDLLWRTVPSDVVQAGALKALVVKLVQTLQANGTLKSGQAPVVAMPYKDDPAGTGLLTESFKDELVSWGTAFEYNADEVSAADAGKRMALAKQIVDLAPNIVLHLGTGEFVEKVIPLIEQMWPAGKLKPWYVVAEGDLEQLQTTDKQGTIRGVITANGIAARLVGTSPGGRRNDPYRLFKLTYMGEPGNLAEFAYDAVYLLAYAIGASNKQYPTGTELAMGLRKVSCKMGGTRVESGPSDFYAGWNALSSGGCIDYWGPSGELDFNMYGEAETDISVGCLQGGAEHYDYVRIDTYFPDATKVLTAGKAAPLDFNAPGWCTPYVP